jgi:hypothetical protein
MSLEKAIRGVLGQKFTTSEPVQEEAVKKESKEEKVVQFIASLNEAKDPEEYDQEGDMMKSQLRQINSAIDKLMGMVKDDDNLPEWVQSKMTKATDYIRSVRDYLESEKMNEEWVCGKCNCDPCTCEESLQEGINQKKFAAGAKAMKAYAMKHGGVDKADFMKVADSLAKISRINLLQAGQELSRLNRLVDNQDTDVRERIYVELKKVGLVEALEEKTLTPAELKKREEIAKAIERENPDMPMPQKMAIATAQAKKTAEAYDEPQGQAKRMMSPLQKARMDKEKADRDRDGKLKPGVIKRVAKEEVELEEAKKVSSMQIHKVLAKTKNSREGIAALKKAFRVNDMEAKKMLNQVMNEEIDEAKKSDETVNIRQSLKKAIDMRGQKEVVFKDGSKAKISVQDAEKAMKMLDNTRMAKAKQDLTIRMMKSHQDFKDTLAGKKPKVDPFALRVKTNEATDDTKMMNREKAKRHMELAKKARADGDYDKANKHTQMARSLQNEGSFASKFKADLKEKKRAMKETKGAPKGYHFTKDGKLKKGDAGQDGPGGKMLRSDPLDKQRSKIPPLPENDK